MARTTSEAGAAKADPGEAVRVGLEVGRAGKGAHPSPVKGRGRGREESGETRASEERARAGRGARERESVAEQPARPRRGSSSCTAMHVQGAHSAQDPASGTASGDGTAISCPSRDSGTFCSSPGSGPAAEEQRSCLCGEAALAGSSSTWSSLTVQDQPEGTVQW